MEETGMSSGMSEIDIKALKETLCAQQQLLQNLYAELDQEREASATAASEALDMIVRLQGEKAAVKMEANHYKRMAEEKIGHAEATLEIFEELMNQKELEMASLELQVQAYKTKLESLGCDLSATELELPGENGENSQSSNLRRLTSLPLVPFNKNSLRATLRMERSPGLILDAKKEQITEEEVPAQSLDLASKSGEFAYGTLSSYWNQIKMLDEKVKVISDFKECEGENTSNSENGRWKSCSMFTQKSKITLTCDQPDTLSCNSLVSNTYDVFDVPQPRENHKVRECWKRVFEKLNAEAGNKLTKPDSVSEEMVDSLVQNKRDNLKSMISTNNEIQITSPRDAMNVTGQKKEVVSIYGSAQAEFQKLYQRIERLERERISIREEIEPEANGTEQLRLLKEVQGHLRLIQSEIRSWRTQKATPEDDDVWLDPLQEATLHCWLSQEDHLRKPIS